MFAILLFLVPVLAFSQSKSPLIGAWKLVSYAHTLPGGEKSYPYGQQPSGLLVYSENGWMSAQLYNQTHPTKPVAVQSATLPELQRLMRGTAYFGRYTLYAKEGKVIHHVERSNRGTSGVDYVRYFKLNGDRLVITVRPEDQQVLGRSGTTELVWERGR